MPLGEAVEEVTLEEAEEEEEEDLVHQEVVHQEVPPEVDTVAVHGVEEVSLLNDLPLLPVTKIMEVSLVQKSFIYTATYSIPTASCYTFQFQFSLIRSMVQIALV